MIDIKLKYTHNNTNDVCFLYKPTFQISMIREQNDMSFVSRFTLKDFEPFPNFPINTPTKPTLDIINLCLDYGLIINIDYRGDNDSRMQGHNRTIYPMAIGVNKDGKYLLRGYHLKGWSLSGGSNVEKEWRLFRMDRVLNITFTGAFYRLPPDGYNTKGDRSMAKMLKNARFNIIRKNQERLIQQRQIDLKDRVVVDKLNNIYTKSLGGNIKLNKPYGDIINKEEANKLRVTFAKPIVGGSMKPSVIIIGTNIVKGKTFKLYDDGKLIDTYRSIDNMMANEIEKLGDTLDEYNEFKAYLFIKAN